MRATDVMTVNVITVTPDMPVQDLAALLGKYGISGVPVVNHANELIGIVSEGDLLHRAETGTLRRTERRRARWLDGLTPDWDKTGRDDARDYLKSHGRTVADVMTRDVITVGETTALDEIADLLETKRIKRVPVARDGKVVGIVSRSNLVRALAMAEPPPANAADTDDFTIREALLAELREKSWALARDADVMVRDGVVHLWCADDQPDADRRALRVAAENIQGVARVEEHVVHIPISPVF